MAEASDTMGMLYQNLVDAGCSDKDTKACMECAANGGWIKLASFLRNHRKQLLDEIHAGQEKLDCLDYLLYQIKKQHQR